MNLFPIPRLSAGERVFGGTDESPILAACLVTTRRQVSTFPPPRVTEERYFLLESLATVPLHKIKRGIIARAKGIKAAKDGEMTAA